MTMLTDFSPTPWVADQHGRIRVAEGLLHGTLVATTIDMPTTLKITQAVNAYDVLKAENARLREILSNLLPAFWNDTIMAKQLRRLYEEHISAAEATLRGKEGA